MQTAAILPTHTPVLFNQAVLETAKLLRSGGVAAVPSETVYGLAANAFSPEAVRGIYRAKGRPSTNPLIVTWPLQPWHERAPRIGQNWRNYWPDIFGQVLSP